MDQKTSCLAETRTGSSSSNVITCSISYLDRLDIHSHLSISTGATTSTKMKAKFGSKKGKREHASINHNEIDEQQRNIVLISTRSSRLRHAMPCYHQIFFLSCFILISTQTCLLLSHPLFHLHQFNPARRETNDQSKQTVNKHEKQRYENETKNSNSIYVSPTLTTKISCISAQRESIHKIQTENQIKSNLKLKCEKRSSGERERERGARE